VNDGFDLGDWDSTAGDAFGSSGPRSAGTISATDRQVMDILGYSSAPYTPPADDYANSLSDTSHPFGLVAAGGQAFGSLQSAGDRDWFQLNVQAGATYKVDLNGEANGAGTLADPYLRLHDPSGALIAENDDFSSSNPDSEVVFTAATSGTYYVEAGAFVDGYAGSYRVTVFQTAGGGAAAAAATPGDDVLNGVPGGDSIDGLAGNDTITGSTGRNILHGGDGDDSITGGADFNEINGNKGQDTIVGRSTSGDWLLGGQGNDSIDATASTGHNILNGNLGDDTLLGGSVGDTLRGGQGDDSIIGGRGNDWLSGDKGHDTLTGGGGADTFHQSPGGGISVVTDFNLAQGDHVQLDPGSAYTINASGADTVIDLGGGSQLILQNVNPSSLPPGSIVLA
jgi:Ca2+-binding RTX toxin-like protein